MGEGAGVVILEEYEHAKKRGARIYAELVGYGMSGDAYHITAPHEDGRGAAHGDEPRAEGRGRRADAGRLHQRPRHQHAAGRPRRDQGGQDAPSASTRRSSPSARPRASSATCSAPAAASRRSITALAIHRNLIPPTINLDNPDPECDLDYRPHKARTARSPTP